MASPGIEGTDNKSVLTGGDFNSTIGVAGEATTIASNVTFTGAVTLPTQTLSSLTASKAVVTDANKALASSSTTSTELGYVSGVTSAIQTQLNTKAPLASPVFTGLPQVPTYVKTSLPTATAVGQVIYVSNATGAHVTGSLAFANATGASNWIDVTTGVAIA